MTETTTATETSQGDTTTTRTGHDTMTGVGIEGMTTMTGTEAEEAAGGIPGTVEGNKTHVATVLGR